MINNWKVDSDFQDFVLIDEVVPPGGSGRGVGLSSGVSNMLQTQLESFNSSRARSWPSALSDERLTRRERTPADGWRPCRRGRHVSGGRLAV